MRKIRAIKFIGIILFVGYVLIGIMAYMERLVSRTDNILFSVLLAILSIFVCFKGSILKSYSTLWFGITLILYALLIVTFEVVKFDYMGYSYVFAFLPLITSTLFICFKKFNYIKIFIINLTIAIPVMFVNILNLKLWLNIAVFTISIIIGIVVCKLIDLSRERFYNG